MAAPEGQGIKRDTAQADFEIHTNEHGGKQSRLPSRMEIVSPEAMLALGEVLAYGAEKYTVDNWKKIPRDSHIGHVIYHAMKALQGDERERFRHTWHMLTRAMFACHMDIVYGREGVETFPEQGTDWARPDTEAHGTYPVPGGITAAPWPRCGHMYSASEARSTCNAPSTFKIIANRTDSDKQEWMWRCVQHLKITLVTGPSYIVEPLS